MRCEFFKDLFLKHFCIVQDKKKHLVFLDIKNLDFCCFKFCSFAFFYREVLPEPWKSKLDSFQRIIVVKCLRPDKVTNAMQDFVAENTGQRFIEPQVKIPNTFIHADLIHLN